MKKLITAALAAALIISTFAACGSKKKTDDYDTTSRVLYSDSDTETETDTETEENDTETDTNTDSESTDSDSSKSEKKVKTTDSDKKSTSKEAESKAASSKAAESKTSSKKSSTYVITPSRASSTAAASSAVSSEETSSKGENTDSESTDSEANTDSVYDPETDTQTDSESKTKGSFAGYNDLDFSYDYYTISLEAPIENVLDNLPGDPEITSAPSCLYPGQEDKSYNYGSFTITTFPNASGTVEYVSGITLTDSDVSTEKDIKIGSTLDDVIAAYGDGYTLIGSSTYRFTTSDGRAFIQFYCEDDVVEEIMISLDSNNI